MTALLAAFPDPFSASLGLVTLVALYLLAPR